MNYDGWIVVGTKLDTKQLEKDLKNSQSKLEKYEKEAERLTTTKAKVEIDIKNSEKKLEQLNNKYEEITKKMENERLKVASVPTWKQQTPEYARQVENLEKLRSKQIDISAKQSEMASKLDMQSQKHSEINRKVKENAKNQQLVKKEVEETTRKLNQAKGFGNISNIAKDIGKSMNSLIKKVGRWTLAVFGVRSAYMFVRQAVSTLSQYNEKMATDLEYIRFAIASMLQKTIENLIQLVYKFLSYVNYIANAWFGINLFANATVDAFNKANVSANKLKKTLAGFDEMTVLNDNGTTSVNGLPTQDLSDVLENSEVPDWLEEFGKHKETIQGVTDSLLILFGTVTITKILKGISTLFGASGGVGLIALKEMLAIIGTAYLVTIAVKGVVEVINQVKELNDILEENIRNEEKLSGKNKELSDTFWKLKDEGKLTETQLNSYRGHLDFTIESSDNLIKSLENQKTWLGAITGANDKLSEHQQILIDKLKGTITEYKKLYDQGLLNEEGQKKYKEALEKTITALHNQGIDVSDLQLQYKNLTGQEYKVVVKADTKDATNKVNSLWDLIKKAFKTTVVGNFAVSAGLAGGSGGGKGFAKGGIVNLPSRGVPLGYNSYAGESGIEGVVPLTDSQQMELLGEAIGRNVTINANIVNSMNGRVISREVKRIDSNSDFAYNS